MPIVSPETSLLVSHLAEEGENAYWTPQSGLVFITVKALYNEFCKSFTDSFKI